MTEITGDRTICAIYSEVLSGADKKIVFSNNYFEGFVGQQFFTKLCTLSAEFAVGIT